MTTNSVTGEVTHCRRDGAGNLDAIGGEGWLLEPELMAADIVATGTESGPYFVTTPTGEAQFITVRRAETGKHFMLSTTHGDGPLTELASLA